MGSSFSKKEINVDLKLENLNNDLKTLILDAKSLINFEHNNNTYKDLKNLIKKDIEYIEDYLNMDFHLSLTVIGCDDKALTLIETFLADNPAINIKKFNIFKNEKRKIQKYEEKLMNFIKEYSNEGNYYNNFFNNELRVFNPYRKIIFSNNLDENNIISDELIFSVPPILCDGMEYQTIKNEILGNSKLLDFEEKQFLNSAEFDEFINDNLNSNYNKSDFFMKFIFTILNNDVNVYIVSDDYKKESEFFNILLKNDFVKSFIRKNKVIVVFPMNSRSMINSQTYEEKNLIKIIASLGLEKFDIDFNCCYDDKIIFLAKLIVKKDDRSHFIPTRLRDSIEKVILRKIDSEYEIICQEYEKIRKEEKEKAEKLQKEVLSDHKNDDKNKDKNKDKKNLISSSKSLDQKIIKVINNLYNENSHKLISKYEFKELYIENLNTEFKTYSNIDKFEEKLYSIIKDELISKLNVAQSHLLFKCYLFLNLINDKDFKFYNYIQSIRDEIINIIDNFNFKVQKSISEFMNTYLKNIDSYCETIEIDKNISLNVDLYESKSRIMDIFRNKNFCKDYRELIVLENKFFDFEKMNIDTIKSLSNYIQLNSRESIKEIVNHYFDLYKNFKNENNQTKNSKNIYNDFNTFKENEDKKNYLPVSYSSKTFRSVNMVNCRTNLDKVISEKLNAFNLIHMIIFNHFGVKYLNVKKPSSFYRLISFSSIFISGILFGLGIGLKLRRRVKIFNFLLSGIILLMGVAFSNYFKNLFVKQCNNYLRTNKFIISKYLRLKLIENKNISEILMKNMGKISDDSLELVNSLVMIQP